MRCLVFRDRMDNFFSGKLPKEERNSMEYHLSICAPCAQRSDDFRRSKNVASDLGLASRASAELDALLGMNQETQNSTPDLSSIPTRRVHTIRLAKT
jgi:anti-sigma factor RsiW